jgi:hypothetical protein
MIVTTFDRSSLISDPRLVSSVASSMRCESAGLPIWPHGPFPYGRGDADLVGTAFAWPSTTDLGLRRTHQARRGENVVRLRPQEVAASNDER